MSRCFAGIVSALRSCIRALQTQSERVPLVQRFFRGTLLLPPFGLLLILLRIRAALRGPIEVETTDRFGTRLRCRLPDLIQMYLYLFGVWEPDVTAYLQRTLKPGRTFIDIGANVGYFSLLASRRLGKHGKVMAIEASPPISRVLKATLELNPDLSANVDIENVAVSDAEGEVELYAGPSHNLGLTSTEQHRGMKRAERVRAAPLHAVVDEEIWQHIQVIKIDVEGGEDRVLRGLLDHADRLPEDAEILVELSPSWWRDRDQTPRNVLTPFLEHGFNVYEIPNSYWPWRYLWPNDVLPPRRLLTIPLKRVARLDVVLSRREVDALA